MNNTNRSIASGLSSNRDWSAVPAHDGGSVWSVDRAGGLVQGPLDLGFLRGQRLLLSLDPGQMALLLNDNRLQAVYLDGGHPLHIGGGANQVPTSASIVFLASDQFSGLRWTKLDPVRWSNRGGLEIIGHCSLLIDGPKRFYERFLKSTTAWDDQSLIAAIDTETRSALAAWMDSAFPGGEASEAEIQACLTGLSTDELSEELVSCGLCCSGISVYTATPPAETASDHRAGQNTGLIHN